MRIPDDLDTMEDYGEQLDCGGIDDWEEAFIRGFESEEVWT